MRPIRREIPPSEREVVPPARPGALRNGRPQAPRPADPAATRARLSEAARHLAERSATSAPAPRPVLAPVPPAGRDDRPPAPAPAAPSGGSTVDLRHQSPQREALARMPEAMARELVAIPLREVPGGIEVAVAELPEPAVQSQITAAVGLRVTFLIAPRKDILRAIDALVQRHRHARPPHPGLRSIGLDPPGRRRRPSGPTSLTPPWSRWSTPSSPRPCATGRPTSTSNPRATGSGSVTAWTARSTTSCRSRRPWARRSSAASRSWRG